MSHLNKVASVCMWRNPRSLLEEVRGQNSKERHKSSLTIELLIKPNFPHYFKQDFYSSNRFQLRAFLKSTGPFQDVTFQDSGLSNPHFTGKRNLTKIYHAYKNIPDTRTRLIDKNVQVYYPPVEGQAKAAYHSLVGINLSTVNP